MKKQKSDSLQDLRKLINEVKQQLREEEGTLQTVAPPDDLDVDTGKRSERAIGLGAPLFIVIHQSAGNPKRAGYVGQGKKNRSTHYEVSQEGEIIKYFDPATVKAYHSGGAMKRAQKRKLKGGVGAGVYNINQLSIGVDFTGCWSPPEDCKGAPVTKGMQKAQVEAGKKLLTELSRKYNIPLRIVPDEKYYNVKNSKIKDWKKIVGLLAEGYGIFRHNNIVRTLCPGDLPIENIIKGIPPEDRNLKPEEPEEPGMLQRAKDERETQAVVDGICGDPGSFDSEEEKLVKAACQFFSFNSQSQWLSRTKEFGPIADEDLTSWNKKTGEWPLWLSYYYMKGFKPTGIEGKASKWSVLATQRRRTTYIWKEHAKRQISVVARDFFTRPKFYSKLGWYQTDKDGYLTPGGRARGSGGWKPGFPPEFLSYVKCGFHTSEVLGCKPMSKDERDNTSWPQYVYDSQSSTKKDSAILEKMRKIWEHVDYYILGHPKGYERAEGKCPDHEDRTGMACDPVKALEFIRKFRDPEYFRCEDVEWVKEQVALNFSKGRDITEVEIQLLDDVKRKEDELVRALRVDDVGLSAGGHRPQRPRGSTLPIGSAERVAARVEKKKQLDYKKEKSLSEEADKKCSEAIRKKRDARDAQFNIERNSIKEDINKLKRNIKILKENMDSERSVKAILHRNGVVLLLRNEDGWDLPGGHVQQTESPSAALKREIYEETGLRLLEQPLYLRGIDHGNKEFYVGAFPRDDISLSDEHSQFGFFTFEECMAKDDLAPFYKDAIKAAMDPESLKDIPSRSSYNQAPAVDSQRGAAGHGGPASHGGVFAPGHGLGGTIR